MRSKKKAESLKRGDAIWVPLASGIYLPNPLCLMRAQVASAKRVGGFVHLRTLEYKEVALPAGTKVSMSRAN